MMIGVVRYDRRGIAPEEQRRKLEAYGCESIWDVGKRSESIEQMIGMRTLRPNDELVVCDLALLPDKGARSGSKLTEHFAAILDSGAKVTELITGRSYQGSSEGVRMLGDARDKLAQRTVGVKKDPGRPRKLDLTNDELEWIGLQWARKDLTNNEQRLSVVGGRFPGFAEHDYYRNRDKIRAALAKRRGGR